MGFFDEITSALGDLGAAKDEVVDQASQQLGEVVPEEVQNTVDDVQSVGENLPGQDGSEQ
jgi:hypothetical protein